MLQRLVHEIKGFLELVVVFLELLRFFLGQVFLCLRTASAANTIVVTIARTGG